MKSSMFIVIVVTFLFAGCAYKNPNNTASTTANANNEKVAEQRLYTFSWQYHDDQGMKPRGGTTRGAPVTLDKSKNTTWSSIYELGISKFEQDRRAILAMAGDYRVTFDFIETVPLQSGYTPKNPYQSWATEIIRVIEDSGNFISLQHILVMYIQNDKGEIEGPFVSKHWRQDWKYEDEEILEYQGNNTWQKVSIPENESQGRWSQAVYQVDDSPRYEALGEWVHDSNYSVWTGYDTWRPLPRREFSVRDDYNVLVSENKIIITPTGWVHEQDNLKMIVDINGIPLKHNPYLVKEVGLNRYERITGTDFSAGMQYWSDTAEFWEDVRDAWANELSKDETVKLNSSYEDRKLYEFLFEYADTISNGNYDAELGASFANSTIKHFINNPENKPDASVY